MFNSITIRYVAIGFIHVLVALILSLSIKYCLKAMLKKCSCHGTFKTLCEMIMVNTFLNSTATQTITCSKRCDWSIL